MGTKNLLEELWKMEVMAIGVEVSFRDWFLKYHNQCGQVASKTAQKFGVSRQTIYNALWKLELLPKTGWKTYTVDCVTGTISELCRHFEKRPNLVFRRLNLGWDLETALKTNLMQRRKKFPAKIEYEGIVCSLSQHAIRKGLPRNLVWGRYKSGWNLEECFRPVKSN